MRILIDVPKSDLELMDEVARKHTISRAEFVRQAITVSLTPYRHKMNHSAFGLWSGKVEDGLIYQKRMREEW